MEGLRKEFDLERIRIQEYYNEKIETLKGERRDEIKTIKADFAERQKIIMNKYQGKKQFNSKIKRMGTPEGDVVKKSHRNSPRTITPEEIR